MKVGRWLHATFAAALAVSATGCAIPYGEAYLASFASGERAFHAGRYDEAARAFDEAAGKAKRPKDRDEARFMEARSFEHAEKWREARAAYERLREDAPKGLRTERAQFEIAELEIAHGDAALGWQMLEKAVVENPRFGVTAPAIRRLIKHAQDQGGDAAALAWLDAHVRVFDGTEEDQEVAYERAMTLERLGRPKEAHDAYLATAKKHPYPSGGLTDDAYWKAAAIDEASGNFTEAITHLRELLAPRESSIGVGSYERSRYGQAQLHLGEIYRDRLKDDRAARREFHKLYADHKTSPKRAEALWYEAILAKRDGDAGEACDLANKIVKEFPESRYDRCAREVCPSAPADKKPCADYIVRAMNGDKGGAGD